MEKPTLDVVVQAIDTLYRSQNNQEKEKASIWLTSLIATVHVWEIADHLLLLKRDVETSYFAAQTMQNKIRYSFDELPEHTHKALRDSLMNHLQQLSDAPSPVTRQLAMALADLAIQMADCNTIVTDLVQRFSQSNATVSVLLDVLIVLPEEIQNRSLRLGQNRRKELTQDLGKDWEMVLSLLIASLTAYSENSEILYRIYACLGSWVQMGNFPAEAMEQSSIVRAPFHTLKLLEIPEKVYEAASDCICSSIFMCEESTYSSFAVMLQEQVLQLLAVFTAAVQSEDYFRAQNISRIFIEMADTFLNHMVHQPSVGLGSLVTLDLLLESVSHPDYEIAESTFNVWYRLSEALLKVDDPDLNEAFRPYIERLITLLCKHCHLDEDTSLTSVVSDDSDDFTTFRRNVVELVRDVLFIVGSQTLFASLYANICKPGTAWNVTEACLFIMYAVAPSLQLDESELLPIAVPVLLSISPDSHYAIRATTLRLVGELAAWIDHHPNTLDLVLRFMVEGLHVQALASYAARAVQNVCLKCKHHMGSHVLGLLQVLHAADELCINNDAILGLLKGIVEILSKFSPEVMRSGIGNLCGLQASALQQLEGVSIGVARGSSADPCVYLDRLATIFRSCVLDLEGDASHPCAALLQELCPVVSATCYKFKHEQRVVERTCRCFRFMIRCVGRGCAPILVSLVNMCVSIYHEYQHSCFLYLGSILVDEFGSQSDYQQGLVQFLEAMADIAFPLLAEAEGLLNHPDTLDDTFRLCARFLQRCPVPFLASRVAPTATQCALASVTINHRDAHASVMKYFRDFLKMTDGIAKEKMSEEEQLLVTHTDDFLNHNGGTLMDGLLNGFIFLPSVMISESAEVLSGLISYAREPMCQLLMSSVEKLQSGKVQVSVAQKSGFISSISRSQSVDDFHGIIMDFARLYR